MFEIDKTSQLITLSASFALAEIERELNLEGYTLGYFTPSSKNLLLQEALEKLLPNLYAPLYGELTEICVSVALRDGEEMRTKVAPRQATGPNWKNLFLGTGKRLGNFTEATLRFSKLPAKILHTWVGFNDLADCLQFEKALIRRELTPRAFGRFSKDEIKNYPRALNGKTILILEWANSNAWLKSAQKEFDHLIGSQHPYRHVDQPKLQSIFAKLLREKMPQPPWGGFKTQKSNSVALDVQREILEVLGH